MILKVFSVFDEKSAFFGQPFFLPHNGVALRSFSDLVSDPQTSVNRHPEDFKLYLIGTFDDNSGGLTSLAQPEFLANATDYVKVK